MFRHTDTSIDTDQQTNRPTDQQTDRCSHLEHSVEPLLRVENVFEAAAVRGHFRLKPRQHRLQLLLRTHVREFADASKRPRAFGRQRIALLPPHFVRGLQWEMGTREEDTALPARTDTQSRTRTQTWAEKRTRQQRKSPPPPRRSLPDLFKAWAISAGVEGNNGKVDGAFAQGHVRDSAGGWVVVCSCHSG